MSVRLQPPPTNTPRRRHSITRPSSTNSPSSHSDSGMPIVIPPSHGDPSLLSSSTTSLATIPININLGVMNNNARPKISRSATGSTYGKQQSDQGRLAVLVEDVVGMGVGSSVEPGLTRTRSRSRGISITSSQNPLIPDSTTPDPTSSANTTFIPPNLNTNDNNPNVVGITIGPSPLTGYRAWGRSTISTNSGGTMGAPLLSPIPQSPAMPGSPQFPIGPSYPPQQTPSSSTASSSTTSYTSTSTSITSPTSSTTSTFLGLGPPPSASSASSSSKNTLTPQDRRKGLTRRISSPTMRGGVGPFVVPVFAGVGLGGAGVGPGAGAGSGGNGGAGEREGMGDEGVGMGMTNASMGSPGLGSGFGPTAQGMTGTYGNGQMRTPSRLQHGYAVGQSYAGPFSDGGSGAGSLSIGEESSFNSMGAYGVPSVSGSGSVPGSASALASGSGSGSGLGSASAAGLHSTYEPYQARPRSTSVNGFADANFGSPTTAAAAGGILGGFWLAGTALLGTMIGGPGSGPGSGSGYAGVDGGGGGEGDDVEFDDNTGRAIGMNAMGKRRSQGSDSEGEKGYITPPLVGQEARTGGGGWLNGLRGGEHSGYFSLAPSGPPGDSGSTLPTPALSTASLSGRRADALDSGNNSSPSKQRRRRATTVGQPQPFSSLRNFFFDIGAGLGGSPSSARSKHSPAPSPSTTPPSLNINIPLELGSEKRQVRTRGNSSAVKRPEGLPQVSYQALTRLQLEEPTVPLLEALRETIKDMGWTLGLLGLVFVSSLAVVALLLRSLPIHALKSLPKKVSDIQILSAEIRSYMSSGSRGWWHVILTLIITGCWKHSWSVPGAVILNILVGSLMKPIPAVILLTVITSLGSLGAYTLSRPLAPLIGLVFPKPLALVRTAISGSSVHAGDDVNAMADTYELPSNEKPTVWRRLLVMRAMGVVPWSGMNVACGVVGVNWMTFLLTTAAGSASWSYVTANVGDILSQLALPKDAMIDGFEQASTGLATGSDTISGGQSLSGLLRDPALIAKLIVLSMLSLLPVLFKSRSDPALAPPPQQLQPGGGPNISLEDQASTPLAPTPSVYYIIASLRHLTKGAIRGAESLWRTGWMSLSTLGLNDQAADRIVASGR